MRAKSVLPTWRELYPMLPVLIQRIFLKLSQIKEDPQWHPEDNALEHIKSVYEKALETDDPDQVMAALFHDLGKAFTAKLKPGTQYSSSHGHENASMYLADLAAMRDFMESFGADPDVVIWIVKNHMRMHKFEEMRHKKQKALKENPAFKKLKIFAKLDSEAKS